VAEILDADVSPATLSQQVRGPRVQTNRIGGRHFPHAAPSLSVAILVAAVCNLREVSEWAGHNRVAFTLGRCGGRFEDGADAAVDRLDNLLGGGGDERAR
jgi:hypothetical protein